MMTLRPCVMQKYHDHHGSFYKVYVIDRDVMVYRRPSLPDLTGTVSLPLSNALPLSPMGASVVRSVAFDSRYSYPTLRDFVLESPSVEGSDTPVYSCAASSPLVTAASITNPIGISEDTGSWKVISSPSPSPARTLIPPKTPSPHTVVEETAMVSLSTTANTSIVGNITSTTEMTTSTTTTGNALYSFPASEKSHEQVNEMLQHTDRLGSKSIQM